MSARAIFILAAGLVFLVGIATKAETPDVRRSESHDYKISRSGKGFGAVGRVRVDQTHLSDRAVSDDLHVIPEYAECKVSKVAAWARGRKLDKDYTLRFQSVEDHVFFNESGTWLISFAGQLKAGEAIAYEYRLDCPDITMFPVIWLPNVDLLDRFQLRFEHPPEMRVDFDFFFPHGPVQYEVDRSNEKVTTLTVAAVAGTPRLSYFAYNEARFGVLVRFYHQDRLFNPVTVEGLGEWYRGLLADVPRTYPNVGASFIDSVRAAGEGRERGRLIYDLIVGNLRYIQEAQRSHAYRPTPPSKVWLDKYGDCKDRAFLARTLADSAGIAVRMVVCPGLPGLGFAGIHSSLTNHVFNALIDGDDTLFFDPTARREPFGCLPESDIGKRVVVVDSVTARLVTVPPPSGTAMTIFLEGSADSLSSLRARVVLRDRELAVALDALKSLAPGALRRALDSLITKRLHRIDLDSLKLTAQSYDSLVLEGSADLSGFVVLSPQRSYLPRVPFTVINVGILSRRTDSLPLYFETRDALKIQVDLDVTGRMLTPDSLLLADGATARCSATARMVDPTHARFEYEFRRQAKIIAGPEKAAFLGFCDDFLNAKKNMFILEVAR